MNKLASIEIISDILPIVGSDNIELAKVLGFQSVVRKGEFKSGDKIVYVALDALIQPAEWNKFLQDKDNPSKPIRIKNRKIRGVFSQGVIFPQSILPFEHPAPYLLYNEAGKEVSDLIGVTKYETPIDISSTGETKGGYYPKKYSISPTDEQNLMGRPELLNEFDGLDSWCSIKKDGRSSTFCYDGEYHVCSRNLEKKNDPANLNSTFIHISNKYELEKRLKSLPYHCLVRGEIAGPKIQANRMNLGKLHLFVFDVYNLNEMRQLGYFEMREFCTHFGLEMVKVIPMPLYTFQFDSKIHTLEWLQDLANKQKYDNNVPAEGIVLRPALPVHSHKLGRNLSCKIINQNYL